MPRRPWEVLERGMEAEAEPDGGKWAGRKRGRWKGVFPNAEHATVEPLNTQSSNR